MAYARSELVRHVAAGPQAAHRDCAIREAQPGEAKMLGLVIIVLFLFLVGARIVSELRG